MSSSGVFVSTVAATETHLFKIEGYNRLKGMHSNGKRLESSRFQAGGHTWRINRYPNGDTTTDAAFVSLYLKLDDGAATPAKDVCAEVAVSLVCHPGTPASLLPPRRESFAVTYNKLQIRSYGFPKFIAKENLDWFSRYIKDYCVFVRCDVIVIEKSPTKEEEVVQAHDMEMVGLACDSKDELCKRHHARVATRVVGLGFRQAFVKFFLRCFQA